MYLSHKNMVMEMILIKQGSNEWEYIWNWLAAHPFNKNLEDPSVALNPINGEYWKYQGSYRGIDGTAVAEFMHRSHPTSNDMVELKVIHNKLTEADIEKIIPIK